MCCICYCYIEISYYLIYYDYSTITPFRYEYWSVYKRDTCFINEQHVIYGKTINVVNKQTGGVFFLHGYGGTSKTFVWRTLESALRSKHKILLTIASSGMSSLLLPGGKVAHSNFKIPVPTLENSLCNIEPKDNLVELLRQT